MNDESNGKGRSAAPDGTGASRGNGAGAGAPSASPPVRDPEQERLRAIALLEATHVFPLDYAISVIAQSSASVIAEVRAAVEVGLSCPLAPEAYETVPSSGGKYASHRFKVPCQTPEEVLALYARLRAVKGVITIL